MAKGLVNALVIVIGIGSMTFVIVGLYYFKCLKVLGSFIFLSSFLLLSVYTMTMWTVANDKYELNVDIITFFYVIANFAFLGVTSIFYDNRKVRSTLRHKKHPKHRRSTKHYSTSRFAWIHSSPHPSLSDRPR
jgi:hypothetical protein